MVELVDTLDLKSNGKKFPCGFKSRSEYRNPLYLIDLEGFLVFKNEISRPFPDISPSAKTFI